MALDNILYDPESPELRHKFHDLSRGWLFGSVFAVVDVSRNLIGVVAAVLLNLPSSVELLRHRSREYLRVHEWCVASATPLVYGIVE